MLKTVRVSEASWRAMKEHSKDLKVSVKRKFSVDSSSEERDSFEQSTSKSFAPTRYALFFSFHLERTMHELFLK